MITVALIAVLLAIGCCTLGLWATLGQHDLRHRWPTRHDTLAGLTADALAVLRREPRRFKATTRYELDRQEEAS